MSDNIVQSILKVVASEDLEKQTEKELAIEDPKPSGQYENT